MSESRVPHQHLDDDQLDEAARAVVNGIAGEWSSLDCAECIARIAAHGRCISLARLLVHDTRAPTGMPAVEAVRAIRRQSYRRRVLGEIGAVLTSAPLKVRA